MTTNAAELPDSDALLKLIQVYKDAEIELLTQITARINSGLDVPEWQQKKLLELQAMQRQLQATLAGILPRSSALLQEAMDQAYNHGDYQALAELTRRAADQRLTVTTLPRSAAITALLNETQRSLMAEHLMALRSSEDIYRSVIQQTVLLEQTGVVTRQQAMQQALDRFASSGVVGYKDSTGRNWSMASYTEMATRTAVIRASVQGKIDRFQERGHNLVYASDHTQECELCRPWEGKVLSLSGDDPRAFATLEAARMAGFLHPGCRHTVGLYIEGVSVPKAEADPQGDADRQRLRAMERNVRSWRKRQAVAATPVAKLNAQAKVKEWTQKIKDHTDSTSAKRQPQREREMVAKEKLIGGVTGGASLESQKKSYRAQLRKIDRTDWSTDPEGLKRALSKRDELKARIESGGKSAPAPALPERATLPPPPKAKAPRTKQADPVPVLAVDADRVITTLNKHMPSARFGNSFPLKLQQPPAPVSTDGAANIAKTFKGINSARRPEQGYRENCSNCAISFELSARDGVQRFALPRLVGRSMHEIVGLTTITSRLDWQMIKGGASSFDLRNMGLSMPHDGARAFLHIEGKTGGHIANVVREKGKFYLYDAQTGKRELLTAEHPYISKSFNARVARSDELKFVETNEVYLTEEDI